MALFDNVKTSWYMTEVQIWLEAQQPKLPKAAEFLRENREKIERMRKSNLTPEKAAFEIQIRFLSIREKESHSHTNTLHPAIRKLL